MPVLSLAAEGTESFNSQIFISGVYFSQCWQTERTWISRGMQCCELNSTVIYKYRRRLTQTHDFHQDLREIFRGPILNPRSWCLNASIWRKRKKTFAKDYIWVVGHGRAAWLTKVQSPIITNGSCRHLKVSLIWKPRKLHHWLSPAPRGWTRKHCLSSRKQSS